MLDIVVGVASSAGSAHVLDVALSEASGTSRPVRILHAWSAPIWVGGPAAIGYASMPSAPENTARARQLADIMLARALVTTASAHVITATTAGPEGAPGDALVQASVDAGLLVVGSRSRGSVGSALLGSATTYALHHASCPVMVVPPTASSGPFRRIVVGFDDSPCSKSALRWALNAARRYGCPLVVTHVLDRAAIPSQMPAAPLLANDRNQLAVWLDCEVARAKTGPDQPGVSTVVRDGIPTQVLLAEAGPQDLLVLGSRGHGGFASLLLGSVATHCARHARGAVVVVRAGNERLEDQQELTAVGVT